MLCPLIFHMHCLPALGAVGRIESTVEVHLAFSHEGFSFLLGRYVIIAMAIQQIAEVPNVVQVFFFLGQHGKTMFMLKGHFLDYCIIQVITDHIKTSTP